MGEGGNKRDWQLKVDDVYKEWKYNDLHKNIKTHFKNANGRENIPEKLRNLVEENSPIISDLNQLHEDVKTEKENVQQRLFVRDSKSTVQFLGSKIDVPESDVEEEEVDNYCKETLFSGFWKTMKKLCDKVYTAIKSGLDVLKKLFKKALDFMEAGLQTIVVAIGKTIAKIVAWANPLPEYEKHEELEDIQCIRNLAFENTEQTINNTPEVTFFPKTIDQVCRIIKHARKEGKRIRAAGMKHSWTDLFSNDGEYLLYLLPLEVTDHLTFSRMSTKEAAEGLDHWGSEMNTIEFQERLDENHASVRVGAATTNLQMLEWSSKTYHDGHRWTLPMNIIALMISYGGSNATITHGAGINNKNLNDIVIKLEFVNALGELQVVDDQSKLKSISGAFGLIGIVTHITFRMDKMTYAKYHPKKTKMLDSIPRPGTDTSDPAFQKMVDLCQNHYYTEFFWFPNNGVDDGYWENCWKNDGEEKDCVELNDALDDNFQIASTYLFDITTLILQPLVFITKDEHYDDNITLREIIRHVFAKIITLTGFNVLPQPDEPITTLLVEALHFRTGFHYIMVREMEMQIPIPSLPDGGPDFEIVSRAWWDAIDVIEKFKFESDNVHVCDMALELRIMGGSDVTMAAQNGNKHGTLSIEPVSTRMVHQEVWEDFKDELARKWMSYRDYDGSLLNTRVHWAKENPRSIQVTEIKRDPIEYWQDVYQDRMKEFFDVLNDLTDGVSIEDIYKSFSNIYLDQVFKPQWDRFGISVNNMKSDQLLKPSANNGNNTEYNSSNVHLKGQDGSKCCTII